MSTNEDMQSIGMSPELAAKLARLGFPNGGRGICHKCQKERDYTHEQIVKLLQSYPWHCGKRIDLVTK